MKELRVFEGFCGIGSQRMALRNKKINYKIVGTMEVDKYAIYAYNSIFDLDKDIKEVTKEEMLKYFSDINIGYNFSTGKSEIPKNNKELTYLYKCSKRMNNYGDIRKIDESVLPDFDLFTYSFPCKNFSLLGKQEGAERGSGTQSSLIWECERIIKYKKPKYLLMENVKALTNKKNIHILNEWCEILKNIGYSNSWKIINSKDYGIPQNRERVIMVSVLNEEKYEFPNKKTLKYRMKDFMLDNVDDKYYLSNEKINKIQNWKAFQRPFERVLGKNSVCPTITARGAGEYHSGMIIYSNKLNDTKNCEKENIDLYSLGIRLLTPKESWRFMGYKDEDFNKVKQSNMLNERKLYERAGRGIVVPILEDIFEKLFINYIY